MIYQSIALILVIIVILYVNRRVYNFKSLLIWLLLMIISLLLYAFKNELNYTYRRFMSVLVPSYHWLDQEGMINIARSSDGHFYIKAKVDSAIMVNFLVDTGASDVALTKETAARLGFNSTNLIFSKTYSTANGSSFGAPITLKTLSMDNIELNNIKAHVMSGDSTESLLGVSVISRFRVFSIKGDILTIGL